MTDYEEFGLSPGATAGQIRRQAESQVRRLNLILAVLTSQRSASFATGAMK